MKMLNVSRLRVHKVWNSMTELISTEIMVAQVDKSALSKVEYKQNLSATLCC